jgi:hypothetical protein
MPKLAQSFGAFGAVDDGRHQLWGEAAGDADRVAVQLVADDLHLAAHNVRRTLSANSAAPDGTGAGTNGGAAAVGGSGTVSRSAPSVAPATPSAIA